MAEAMKLIPESLSMKRLIWEQLSKPSLGTFSRYFVLTWALAGSGIVLFTRAPSPITFVLGSIILGLAQHRMALLGHDAAHGNACRNRFLNDAIGIAGCIFPLGITLSSYRCLHFPHHRDPAGPGDPELPVRRAMGKNWAGDLSTTRGLQLWGRSLLGFSLAELSVFVAKLPPGSRKERIYLASYWLIAAASAVLLHQEALLALWFFALSTTYFSTLRIQTWHEHSLPESNEAATNRFSLPNGIYRILFPLNSWCHYEHHRFPKVPFYHLPKVRALCLEDRIVSFSEMLAKERERCSPLAAKNFFLVQEEVDSAPRKQNQSERSRSA